MSLSAQPAALYWPARYCASSGTLPRPATVGVSMACLNNSRALACHGLPAGAATAEPASSAVASITVRIKNPPGWKRQAESAVIPWAPAAKCAVEPAWLCRMWWLRRRSGRVPRVAIALSRQRQQQSGDAGHADDQVHGAGARNTGQRQRFQRGDTALHEEMQH